MKSVLVRFGIGLGFGVSASLILALTMPWIGYLIGVIIIGAVFVSVGEFFMYEMKGKGNRW